VAAKCAGLLGSRQLGFGVPGGAEAASHAVRRYLAHLPSNAIFIKLDFTNAFNTIRRDCVLEAVTKYVPELQAFVSSAYASSSLLAFGEYLVESAEGVQQGDPLGPLLFCLTLHEALARASCDVVVGFLDDVSLGGDIKHVFQALEVLKKESAEMGLTINAAKCEVLGLTETNEGEWDAHGLGFSKVPLSRATMLGSPLFDGPFLSHRLSEFNENLQAISPRLELLPSHDAFYLLRQVFFLPRLSYIIRSAPCFLSEELVFLDTTVRSLMSRVANLEFTDIMWTQATLPVRWGGLGVRSAVKLAPCAFLASAAGAADLCSALLPHGQGAQPDLYVEQARQIWHALGGVAAPSAQGARSQRMWDEDICRSTYGNIQNSSNDPTFQSRILAASMKGSGDWLKAVPLAAIGLKLDDRALSIAIGLRVGANIVGNHKCKCGAQVLQNGHHGLSCRRSAGRHYRHDAINDIIVRALRSAAIPASREPAGLIRGDGKRPDGVSLIPWLRGQCMAWDATCPDTFAQSHLHTSSATAGVVAAEAESAKRLKYAGLANRVLFVPIAVETAGPWGPEARQFTAELGKRLAVATGEQRSTEFLRQRISIAVQRGNAASVQGTFEVEEVPSSEAWPC